MENLVDYSNYVKAAYLTVGVILGSLAIFTIAKYYSLKNGKKN